MTHSLPMLGEQSKDTAFFTALRLQALCTCRPGVRLRPTLTESCDPFLLESVGENSVLNCIAKYKCTKGTVCRLL